MPRSPEHRTKGRDLVRCSIFGTRLKKIEERLEERNGKRALAWILDVLKTLLPSIVLAALGFALKDSGSPSRSRRRVESWKPRRNSSRRVFTPLSRSAGRRTPANAKSVTLQVIKASAWPGSHDQNCPRAQDPAAMVNKAEPAWCLQRAILAPTSLAACDHNSSSV